VLTRRPLLQPSLPDPDPTDLISSGVFGPIQPVPPGAGVYDQLAGWLGRKV